MLTEHKLTLTTNSGGIATGYFPSVSGYIVRMRYVKVDFADGVDFTITLNTAGETVWTQLTQNASAIKYPRIGLHSNAGVALLFEGANTQTDRIPLHNDKVKVAVAEGGSGKSGDFYLLVEE